MDNLYNNAMDEIDYGAKIKVIGAGGGGGNAVKHMVECGVTGVDFTILNTDIQAITESAVTEKIQIGVKLTRGLGAGANPDVGKRAAEESIGEITESLTGCDLVFITAGMGGGTGTGSASVVAQKAREMGILTVAVVTLPFGFEGKSRMRKALEGKRLLAEQVDTIITIPNDRLITLMEQQGKKVTMVSAFNEANKVLRHAVQGITDLIKKPGIINLDFADIKTIMSIRGSSLMGIGSGKGVERIREATEAAMKNPLLEHDITGAKGLIFNITGNEDLGFEDFVAANNIISELVADDCEYIVGTGLDENMAPDTVQVTVVATGFDDEAIAKQKEAKETPSGNRQEFSKDVHVPQASSYAYKRDEENVRASERYVERAPERAPERYAERAPAPERYVERAPERAPERYVERAPERAPERYADRTQERYADHTQERYADRTQERYTERASEDVVEDEFVTKQMDSILAGLNMPEFMSKRRTN